MYKTIPQLAKIKQHRSYPDFPEDVFVKLQERARRNLRSIRSEVVAIVREAVNEQTMEVVS